MPSSSMPLLLALPVLLIAVVMAFVFLASRKRRTGADVAEMQQVLLESRERIEALEVRLGRLETCEEKPREGSSREDLAALARRVDAMAALNESPVEQAPGPEEVPDPEEEVRRGLGHSGYEEVVLLASGGGGGRAWGFEARRRGVAVKGRVFLDPAGQVEIRPTASVRAFP